jgi:uncharacterized caspase-like protein
MVNLVKSLIQAKVRRSLRIVAAQPSCSSRLAWLIAVLGTNNALAYGGENSNHVQDMTQTAAHRAAAVTVVEGFFKHHCADFFAGTATSLCGPFQYTSIGR